MHNHTIEKLYKGQLDNGIQLTASECKEIIIAMDEHRATMAQFKRIQEETNSRLKIMENKITNSGLFTSTVG